MGFLFRTLPGPFRVALIILGSVTIGIAAPAALISFDVVDNQAWDASLAVTWTGVLVAFLAFSLIVGTFIANSTPVRAILLPHLSSDGTSINLDATTTLGSGVLTGFSLDIFIAYTPGTSIRFNGVDHRILDGPHLVDRSVGDSAGKMGYMTIAASFGNLNMAPGSRFHLGSIVADGGTIAAIGNWFIHGPGWTTYWVPRVLWIKRWSRHLLRLRPRWIKK